MAFRAKPEIGGAMIKGVHTMFYSSEVEALRVFIRDKLGFKATDVGGGWLIFDIPEADMGCHPVQVLKGSNPDEPKSGDHYISFSLLILPHHLDLLPSYLFLCSSQVR